MRRLLRFVLTHLFQLKLINFQTICFNEKAIIIPNHVSFLDAVLLFLFLPSNTVFVVNSDVARTFSFFVHFSHHITINPSNPYSLKKIIQLVNSATPVVLFPEGRITRTGGLMKIYDGVGYIAAYTGAKLYPLAILGAEQSKLSRIQDKLTTRWFPTVTMFVDQSVTLELNRSRRIKTQKRQLSDQIRDIMQNALFRAKQHKSNHLFRNLLTASSMHGGNKQIIEDINGTMTYKKLLLASYTLASSLKKCIVEQQNIGLLLPNSIGHTIAFFALCRNGKTPAILNFTAGSQACLHCMDAANIRTVITSKQFIEKAGLENLAEAVASKSKLIFLEDIKYSLTLWNKVSALLQYIAKYCPKEQENGKVILFTSGSENAPKGVVLSHSALLSNIHQMTSVIDIMPRDKMFNALPMFHSFGLTAGTLLPILCGTEVFLYPSPLHYKVIPELVYDRNMTILLGTSTFFGAYGKQAHPYDFYSIRYAIVGGEKLNASVRELWQDKFGIRILEGYGTTETAPVLGLNTNYFYRKGTVGKFLPGIDFRLEVVEGLSGGSLWVKGPNLMDGYLLNHYNFVPSGEWYNTGDVVTIDENGFITIQARLKRFAKVSGEMISLNQVEQAAEQVFAGNCAAIGISDSLRGEKIVLYTTTASSSRQKLREHLTQAQLSPLLLPSEIITLDQLPLLGSGKTDYVALREGRLKGRDPE